MTGRERGGARPLRIGVSACFFHADPTRPVFKGKTLLYAEESMLDLLGRCGALAYLIPRPAPNGPSIEDYVHDLDGLLLEGGSDVCPRSYGEEPLRPEWAGDEPRDRYEIDLIHAFHDAGKPVLGICRGVQILNVAFGGHALPGRHHAARRGVRAPQLGHLRHQPPRGGAGRRARTWPGCTARPGQSPSTASTTRR